MNTHSRSTVKSTLAAAFSALLVLTALASAQSDATLSGLAPSAGTLTPAFASGSLTYTDSVPYATTDITVTPTATDFAATITVFSSSLTPWNICEINKNITPSTVETARPDAPPHIQPTPS